MQILYTIHMCQGSVAMLLSWYPFSMKSDISQGKTDSRKFITKLVTELKKIIISMDIKRVVIDPITLLIMLPVLVPISFCGPYSSFIMPVA